MNRILPGGLIIALAVAFAGALLHAEDSSGANGANVSIQNMKYSPATITIKPGQSVTWTNNDDRDHTVVADDGSFQSDNISAGGTYRHKFTKAGRYKYGCRYHPRMKGEVVVGE